MQLDTGADLYQLNCIVSEIYSIRLDNSCILAVIQKSTFILVRLRNLHVSFSGHIIAGLNHYESRDGLLDT